MSGLDKIDMVILNSLQGDGRITNVKLAERAGISAPPCLRRLRLMENRGIISGYHADINPHSIGYKLKTMCIVSLRSQTTDHVHEFLDAISKIKEVRSCFSTPGNEAFILTIYSKDLADYEKILRSDIQGIKVVSGVKTYIIANKHKDEYGVPIAS